MSYSQFLKGRAIQTGCEWRLRFSVNSSSLDVFGPGAKFAAQVRRNADDPAALATLTTQTGEIIRVDNNSLEIVLRANVTKDWAAGKVVMDIVRTDTSSPVHLGFDLEIPVKRTITRV